MSKIKIDVIQITQRQSKAGNTFYILDAYAHLGNRYPDKVGIFLFDPPNNLLPDGQYDIPYSIGVDRNGNLELQLHIDQAVIVKG